MINTALSHTIVSHSIKYLTNYRSFTCSMEKRNIVIQLIIAAIMIFSLSYGFMYNWPDFQHLKYGIPLTWGTHQLSSIAGPVDLWRVNLVSLVVDLVFWIIIMVLSPWISSLVMQREQRS
jgi:hypothetical protein